MVKKATKTKVVTETKRRNSVLANRLKAPVSQPQGGQLPEMSTFVQEHLSEQPVFRSSEEAVAWWTGKIAERMESDPKERVAMQEFLQMMVETDPMLQEQLLREIKGKK